MVSCKVRNITTDDEIGCIIHGKFNNELCDTYILFGEEETCLSKFYPDFAESIRNFEVENSDIWVCTFPKAGTIWMQEIVWLIANDLNFAGAKTCLERRFPHFEVCTIFDFEKMDNALGVKSPECSSNSLEYTKHQKNPRFIRTHLPFSLLPQEIQNGSKSPKIIYVTRNPKEVCVSYYHYGKSLLGWTANLENFSKVFMANKILYGSFWKHVFGFWERRSSPNLLIVSYEDIKTNLPLVIQKVANFLDKKLTSEQIVELCKHLNINFMLTKESVHSQDCTEITKKENIGDVGFVNKLETDEIYKKELPRDIIERFDVWIKENIAETSFGLENDFSL